MISTNKSALLVLVLVSVCGFARGQSRSEAIVVATRFADQLALSIGEPSVTRHEELGTWSVHLGSFTIEVTPDCREVRSLSLPYGRNDTTDDGSRRLQVPSLEAAVSVAEELLARIGLSDFVFREGKPELDQRTGRPVEFSLQFEERAPGGYRGFVNRASVSVLAHDGRVVRYFAVLHHTYDSPDVRLTPEEAVNRVRNRIDTVYGAYGGTFSDARVNPLAYATDYLPEDDTSGRYSTRGELADDYGPPRGGVHRSRLAYGVIGTVTFVRGGSAEFRALVDAKDGTVMYGRVEEPKSGGRGAPPAAALAKTAAAGRRKLGFDPVLAGAGLAVAAGAAWVAAALRKRATRRQAAGEAD